MEGNGAMIKTPKGRSLGLKKTTPDPRDHRFIPSSLGFATIAAPPPSVDLRGQLPPAFDQGDIGSCGPNAGAALAHFFFSKGPLLSRLQLYANVRTYEGDFLADEGVETRDVLKSLVKDGIGPEDRWPYNPANLYKSPPKNILPNFKLASYSRLISEDDYRICLLSAPFLLGLTLYESFDGDEIEKTGILVTPDPKREQVIGGHDVLAVGYDMNFKTSDVFKRSGLDPATVENEMLLIRNSWGTDWGINGHFYLPFSYALNPTVGGDAWTGRP
jgi:hypothetical protein